MAQGLAVRDRAILNRQIAALDRASRLTIHRISDSQRLMFQRHSDLLQRSYVTYAKSLGRQRAATAIVDDTYRRTYMNTSCARSPDEAIDLWRLVKAGYQPRSWKFAMEYERQRTVEMIEEIGALKSRNAQTVRGTKCFQILTQGDGCPDDEEVRTVVPRRDSDDQGRKAQNTGCGAPTSAAKTVFFERSVSVPASTKPLRKRIEPSQLRRLSAPSPLSHRDYGTKISTVISVVIPGDTYRPTVPTKGASTAEGVPLPQVVVPHRKQQKTRRESIPPECDPDRPWPLGQRCDPEDPRYWTERERQERIFRPRIEEFFRRIEPLRNTGVDRVEELEHELRWCRGTPCAAEPLPHVARSDSG